MRALAITLGVTLTLALFVIANRAAFEGYFSDDDLDNLSWATVAGQDTFVRELLTPVFSESNTRPAGGLYYRWMGRAFGLNFPRYIPPLFAIHILNAALLFWLLRRKKIPELPAALGTLFFLFHASLLEAWWKPMYIFDLLCGAFLLLTWHIFLSRWWPGALLTFGLAYKSKEVALFFPILLAFDDFRHALPFFFVSLNFGVQALLVNRTRESVYTLRFTPAALAATVPFYLKHVVLNKFGALLLAPLAWFARDRQFWRYAIAAIALLIPLLFLPGRLFPVYLYVPMIPITMGLAVLFQSVPRPALALGLVLFLALDYQRLREKRKEELAIAQESRAWVQQLAAAQVASPLPATAYYQNAPAGLRLHGMRGALRLITNRPDARVLDPESLAARRETKERELPVLYWFAPEQKLSIIPHRQGEAKLHFLQLASPETCWQLEDGWYEREGGFRWTGRQASAVVSALPRARTFQIQLNIGRLLIESVKQVTVEVLLDGQPLTQLRFDSPQVSTTDVPIPAAQAVTFNGQAMKVEFRVSPGYRPPADGRELGVAVSGFGFVL